jgi:hypothetical protein
MMRLLCGRLVVDGLIVSSTSCGSIFPMRRRLSHFFPLSRTIPSSSTAARLSCLQQYHSGLRPRPTEDIVCNASARDAGADYNDIRGLGQALWGTEASDFMVWRILPARNGGVVLRKRHRNRDSVLHLANKDDAKPAKRFLLRLHHSPSGAAFIPGPVPSTYFNLPVC